LVCYNNKKQPKAALLWARGGNMKKPIKFNTLSASWKRKMKMKKHGWTAICLMVVAQQTKVPFSRTKTSN
jgi:hypothetical protein